MRAPLVIAASFFLLLTELTAQPTVNYFHADSLKKTVEVLASDSLKGRANFTVYLEKAALFITEEFKKAGLKYLDYPSYLHPFVATDFPNQSFEKISLSGKLLNFKEYYFKTSIWNVPQLIPQDFKVISLKDIKKENLIKFINANVDSITEPILFTIPSLQKQNWTFLLKNKKDLKDPSHTMLILISDDPLPDINVSAKPGLRERTLFNVVGVLPGRNLADEVVLITAHYDHIGLAADGVDVFNGANDNASGTAAMLAIAKSFVARRNNERTIIFIAFAGEEIGLKGSTYMSEFFDLGKIKAMFNLEMLGKSGAEGDGALIMTGHRESNLEAIMKKYCTTIKIRNDRNESEKLFLRSDNYPFASKGVIAHTFMCFLPDDVDYHKTSDEVSTLNFENMSKLVKGLLPGIEAVVSGAETPKK